MVRRNYEALVSGDGACAGCGEKSILRGITSVTEAYMRPLYHKKAERLRGKATRLENEGVARLEALKACDEAEYKLFRRAAAHVIMGLGGENDADTAKRIADYEAKHGAISDQQIINGIAAVMRQDAFNHRDLQAIDGREANGMSVMFMGASTGCNTVYGSTPPSNPHPYPWMNSLFQDGATIQLVAMVKVAHFGITPAAPVVPERLTDALLDRQDDVMTEAGYFTLAHLDDALMTDQEIRELPKVWVSLTAVRRAASDIGFQNVSKVILQNRPNVKMIMLDTQVYSNTGGQNSDSSTMLGGYDMNQFGVASQGKLIEKKNVAEAFTQRLRARRLWREVSIANCGETLARRCWTAWSIVARLFSRLTRPASPSMACRTICPPNRPSSCGTPQHARTVFNGRAAAKPQEAFDIKSDPSPERAVGGAQNMKDPRSEAFEYRIRRGIGNAHRRSLPQASEIHQGRRCVRDDSF